MKKKKADITIRVIKKPSKKLAANVEFLMEQLLPGARRRDTQSEFHKLLQNPNAILVGAFHNEYKVLAGIVTLYRVETMGRRYVLFEECIVDERFRGEGIGQSLTRFVINLIEENEEYGDRIEGTAHESNIGAWQAYLKGGFHDRHNRAFFWVRHWV